MGLALWLAVSAFLHPAPKQQASDTIPEWLIGNVFRWLPLVHRWHADFPELDPAWVLGLIAQESQGDPYAIADDTWGSVGLMQIGPRPWIGTRDRLLDPVFNTWKGMSILSDVLAQTEGDIREALAGYNCGLRRLAKDLCGEHGGWAYADRILNHFVPVFRAELAVRAGESDLIGDWLADLGYREGLGRWEVVEQQESGAWCYPMRRLRPLFCVR